MIIIKESGRKRKKHDFYPTPLEFCKAVVNLVDFYPAFICDPGAGNGVWGRALREKFPHAMLDGVELQPLDKPGWYDSWYIGDYLKYEPFIYKYDLIIGNPPYSLAEEFICHSMDLLSDYGVLIFLLRLSFLESKSRVRGLFKEFPPSNVFVSASRISFTGDGKNDDQAYAVFWWTKRKTQNWFIGSWLDWKD